MPSATIPYIPNDPSTFSSFFPYVSSHMVSPFYDHVGVQSNVTGTEGRGCLKDISKDDMTADWLT